MMPQNNFPDPKPHQHSRLTLTEAIAQYHDGLLTAAGLLYHAIRIYRKDGQTLRIANISTFCQKLEISRRAFYKAKAHLIQAGYLEEEIKEAIDLTVTIRSQVRTTGNTCEQSVTQCEQSVTQCEQSVTVTPSKPLPGKASSASSNIYQIFINSLSNSAREKFLNFVREKVKNFKSPINDIEAWLAGQNQAGKERFRVYYEMFQTQVGEAVAPSQDWENHPQREEWIAQIRRGGKPSFVVQGGPREQREMRQAFADWAVAHHLVWGNQP